MMRLPKPGQAGFTIIELVLVMAISGLLLAGVIASQSGEGNRSSFSGGIAQLQASVKQVQNEATATITTRIGGGSSAYAVFGKLILFNHASPTLYTEYTLVAPVDDPSNNGLAECDQTSVNLPQGITYRDATNKAIMFTHDSSQMYAVNGYDNTTGGLPASINPLNDATVCSAGPDSGPPVIPPSPPPSPPPPPPPVPVLATSGCTGPVGVGWSGNSCKSDDTIAVHVTGVNAGDRCAIKNSGSTIITLTASGTSCSGSFTFSALGLGNGQTGHPVAYVTDNSIVYTSNATSLTAWPPAFVNYACSWSDPNAHDGFSNWYFTVNSDPCLPGTQCYTQGGSCTTYTQDLESYGMDIACRYGAIYVYGTTWDGTDYDGIPCPPGSVEAFRAPPPGSQTKEVAGRSPNSLSGLGHQIVAQLPNPLEWLVPTAQAAGFATNLRDPNNYSPSNASFFSQLQINFTNPTDANQIGTINVNPPADQITQSFNY